MQMCILSISKGAPDKKLLFFSLFPPRLRVPRSEAGAGLPCGLQVTELLHPTQAAQRNPKRLGEKQLCRVSSCALPAAASPRGTPPSPQIIITSSSTSPASAFLPLTPSAQLTARAEALLGLCARAALTLGLQHVLSVQEAAAKCRGKRRGRARARNAAGARPG